MIWFLLMSLVSPPIVEVSPDFYITDDGVNPEASLGYPYDALVYKDRLYIADYYSNIMVYDKSGLVNLIGTQGAGPMELKEAPIYLSIENDELMVVAMYGWERAWYTLEGQFLRKEKLERQWTITRSTEFINFEWNRVTDAGYRYLHLDSGCPMSEVAPYSDKKYHLAKAILFRDKDQLYAIRKSGSISVYDQHCQLVNDVVVPLEIFKKDLVVDEIGASLNRAIKSRRGLTAYRYGLPVISAAIENGRHAWLLVSDENNQKKQRKPGTTWLYRINLEKGSVEYKSQLDEPANIIRISDGYLVITATQSAWVKAWKLEQLKPALSQQIH